MSDSPKAIVGYTLAPWEHALATLRLVGPIQEAGLQLIRGNLYEDVHPDRISQAGIVVTQRDFPRFSAAYSEVLARAREEGKPVILDLDDLLFELPEDHPDRQTHFYAGALLPVFRALLEADAVTASTPLLCDYLRQFTPNVWLLSNYLNDGLWRLRAPTAPDGDKGPVIIGYMGGDSHRPDLDLVLPSLSEILKRHGPLVRLRFWGIQPPLDLQNLPNVEWIPLNIQDYTQFAQFFQEQECDVFIAPLVDSLFNRCKSPIKFLEYSSLGVPGIYSRVPPYADLINHGENGFLASDREEWTELLSRLIQDAELRYQIGLQALETVRRDWLLSQHAHEWRETYQNIQASADCPPAPKSPHLDLALRLADQNQEWQRSLQTRIQEQEQENRRLSAELSAIYQSSSWLMMKKVQNFRRLVIPEGSQRERALRSFISRFRT